jgi:rubrerythrin
MNMVGAAALTFIVLSAVPAAQAADATPVQKVLQMLSDLQSKIIREGADAQKVYDEFSEFCEDRSKNFGFEIKTGKGDVQSLEAAIQKETATAESLNAQIEELASGISTNEADLNAATEIRTKEKASFVAEEQELTDVINTLERAISVIEKEMNGKGAAMMQLKSAANVAQALTVMVQATSLNSADAAKLTALVQSSEDSDEMGAPAGAVYTSSSGGIVGTLQDLFDKAQNQLEEARKAETKSNQAYQMLAQSLKDEIKYA